MSNLANLFYFFINHLHENATEWRGVSFPFGFRTLEALVGHSKKYFKLRLKSNKESLLFCYCEKIQPLFMLVLKKGDGILKHTLDYSELGDFYERQ